MRKGTAHSKESIKKMRLIKIGKHLSIEHRKKIGRKGEENAFFGRKHSDETKRKMRAMWKKRKPFSIERNKKISIALSKRIIKDSTREKHRILRLGAKCVFWKGGVSKENELARKSLQYRQWRTLVFKRDEYACVIGGRAHGKYLHADHIKSFSKYPELRFVVSNGRTLCVPCHKLTDTYGKNL